MVLKFPKQKMRLLRRLVTEQEIRTVLQNSLEELPEHALYKVGDTIYALVGGIIPTKLTVYGAKAGGFGTVYTLLDERLRRFCLKVPRASSVDEKEEARIRKEAELWLRLGKHPNIAYAYSVLELNGSIGLMIEYLSGGDVSRRMRDKRLSIPEVIAYGIQISRGLSYAQTRIRGFVHGDLKPSNCLLTADGTLRVTDFGQVRTVEQPINTYSKPNDSSEALMPGAKPSHWTAGTPAYMAPEQFDATAEPDARSDIYSLGITLFEMATGQRPFSGRYHEECFHQHTTATPASPSSLSADVPPQLSSLILRCLSKLPSERPQDFSIIEAELADIYRREFGSALPESTPGTLTDEEKIAQSAGLLSLGQHARAIDQLDHLLATNPDSAPAWAVRGEALAVVGQANDAEACFTRAADLDPKLAFAWSGIGEVMVQRHLYEEALPYFDKAIALDRKVPAFWYEKGTVLFKLGLVRNAAKCFRRSMAIDARQAVIFSALGNTQFDLGDIDAAIKSYESAIALDSRSIETRVQLANAYYSRGLFDRAIETCRDALALRPGNLSPQARLSAACQALYRELKSGSAEDAEEIFALLSKDSDANTLVNLFLQCLAKSNYDPLVFYLCASKLHSVANKVSPVTMWKLKEALSRIDVKEVWHRTTLYWLGRLFYRIGDYDSCARTFTESVMRLGGDDKSLYYLALCHELKQEYSQALDFYRQVLAIDPRCDLSRAAVRRLKRRARSATPLYDAQVLVVDNALADVKLAAI